jgi:hypothetical protein
LKKYVTASPIPVDILIWPLRCLQVVQDPNWTWATSMDPWVQTRAERSASVGKSEPGNEYLVTSCYFLWCFVSYLLHLLQGNFKKMAITTRSVYNGKHEQAYPCFVNFGMEISLVQNSSMKCY